MCLFVYSYIKRILANVGHFPTWILGISNIFRLLFKVSRIAYIIDNRYISQPGDCWYDVHMKL